MVSLFHLPHIVMVSVPTNSIWGWIWHERMHTNTQKREKKNNALAFHSIINKAQSWLLYSSISWTSELIWYDIQFANNNIKKSANTHAALPVFFFFNFSFDNKMNSLKWNDRRILGHFYHSMFVDVLVLIHISAFFFHLFWRFFSPRQQMNECVCLSSAIDPLYYTIYTCWTLARRICKLKYNHTLFTSCIHADRKIKLVLA